MDSDRLIRPALTKLTTIVVDALELCIKAVIIIPVNNPMARLRVMVDKIDLRRFPAAFCKPSLITFMP